jgi:hypothetical protein
MNKNLRMTGDPASLRRVGVLEVVPVALGRRFDVPRRRALTPGALRDFHQAQGYGSSLVSAFVVAKDSAAFAASQ